MPIIRRLLPQWIAAALQLIAEDANQNMTDTTVSAHYDVTRELCTSLSPTEAVATGLAVRGAILGGVDSEAIRDLIVIDVLPKSIGIVLPASDVTAEDAVPVTRTSAVDADGDMSMSAVFVPIIRRGDRLPAVASRDFTLQRNGQASGRIALAVYEEIYESRVSESPQQQQQHQHRRCNQIGTIDVPVALQSASGSELTVTVQISCDMDMRLSFDVFEKGAERAIEKDRRDHLASYLETFLLPLAIAVLAVLYIAIRFGLLNLPATASSLE